MKQAILISCVSVLISLLFSSAQAQSAQIQVTAMTETEEQSRQDALRKGQSVPVLVQSLPRNQYAEVLKMKLATTWDKNPRIKERLAKSQKHHGPLQCIFNVYKGGQFSQLRIYSSSGDYSFDKAGLEAVRYSPPFQASPNFFGDKAIIIVSFE